VTSDLRPGRSCPLHYRYSPSAFARAPDLTAETLYVIGGLYGNLPALEAVLELAAHETAPVTLAFNGDFNWFNIDGATFETINREVLRHHALRGNVETEIAHDDAAAGCGCGYPDWVGAAEVERSNNIIVTLRDTAKRFPQLRRALAALPMHLVADIGGVRIAIVHGDLESLAGWGLAQETFILNENKNILINQILKSNCRIVASSHTCLPLGSTFDTPLGRCAVFNNGAAGMPNFHGERCGVLTRIATRPATPVTPLYGTRIGAVHVDALAVRYDHERWQRDFLKLWPTGTPAHESYFRRIMDGPDYTLAQAQQLL